MTKNKIVKKLSIDEIKEELSKHGLSTDPKLVLRNAEKIFTKNGNKKLALTPDNDLFKAMTLLEFDNGILLTTLVAEQYRTFGIDLMRNIQREYSCETVTEKATAELISINYIRILEIQSRITRYLNMGTITDTGVRFLAIMSLELERANRQYLLAFEALRSIKSPSSSVNIKSQTNFIGENKVIQIKEVANNS